MFNHGGGFFTPKNFQFPQHFTPKTLIGHSTTTNESCSLMLDSDVRSVTYALKSSKESTLRQETNSTQGENKNIRMIEYEEFEKSNSSQIQYSQEQNNHHNNLIVDVSTGRSGKLIAEGTLSHADSEERNQEQNLQFDFKLKQQQQSISSSQQLLDSQNFTENQRNNLQSNDFWIQNVKLDSELQFVNKSLQKLDLIENIQNIQDENKLLGFRHDDLSSNNILLQNNQQENHMDNINQIILTQEKPKNRMQIIELQQQPEQQQQEQVIKTAQSGKEKSKIYVQDNNFQESIIYEEEDSENSKSTDRQYYKLNRSISNQILGQINSMPRCQSSARNESQQKNCSNKNLHNTSKNSQASFNQSVQAFNIEEENSGSKQQQQQILFQQNQIKSQENSQQMQDINLPNLSEQLIYQVEQQIEQKNQNNIKFVTFDSQQNQNQQTKQSYQQSKEQLKNSFFQANKQHLCITNIDTNFQNQDFNQKPFSSFQQNNEIIYEFFGAGKKDNIKDCQDVYKQQQNIDIEEVQLQENQIQNDNFNSDLIQITSQNQNLKQNQSELDEEYKKEAGSDKLFYPNSSKCNQSSLEECYNNYQQDNEIKENQINGPIQKLNFDQCQSSEGSQSSRDDLNNDSIILKQNFQNLITNYKKRNSSFPQLSNSHNTSKNSNYNTNSNPQIEVSQSINHMKGTSVSNSNKINENKVLQDNLEEQDSQQQPFRSGQYSVILKKLEETLDMNSESDFYLIKKLQLSHGHGVSQQHSEIDNSQNQIQPQITQQYKKINPITNQTYILEETGEDFIFNSKEIERLEQIDNSFFANNKENMGGQNSSINFDSKVLLADTIYSSCNTSHLYFINQSSEKRGFKSHQKERKSHFINIHENSYNQQLQNGTSQLNKVKKNCQNENQIPCQALSKAQQQQINKICLDNQNSKNSLLHLNQQNETNQIQMQNRNSQVSNESSNQEINYIKEIEYLKREVIKLNKDLKNIDIQNYKYQEIIDQQQANILRLEEKLIYYKDEVKSKQQQIENKDMQINKLFEEKEELKQKKKKLKEQIKAKNQEIYQQQRVNYTAKNEAIHKLQQQIDQKNGILNERNEQFQVIQQQISDTSSQLEAKQQEIHYLIQENLQLKEQIKFYSYDQSNSYLQTSNKSFTGNTSQFNQNCARNNKVANSEYNNKYESNLQPNQTTSSSSSSSTQYVQQFIQSGNNSQDQKSSNLSNQNDKRIRSFSQNDTCNQNQFYGQKTALNLDHMISSQPYNLTEESQQFLTKSTQQDIISSQEMQGQQIFSHPRSSFQGNQMIGADQNQNRFQNSLQGNQDKLKNQQVRYSYDNYKNYQQNQQKPTNLPQPMTLNSAIAQYKIQALEDRKYTETINNTNSSNPILVNQQYNPLESSFKQSKSQKQIENNTNSSTSFGFNCNESISQLGNRSQISTSCNSRHYESHASNSQVASNNNSQKSLISVNQKNQQNQYQQQQQKQQIHQQNNYYEKNDPQSNVRSRTGDHSSKNPQYTTFNEKARNSSSQTSKEVYSQNSRLHNNYSNKENLQQKFENTQQNNLNKNYSTKLQENTVLNLQNNKQLNNFNQNQIKLNFQVGERVSTSPSRNQKGNQIIHDELNEYNSVPSYTNNELVQENKQLLGEYIYQNQLNGRKQMQNNIDVASINNKINSNNKLIQNLNLNKNKQSSCQGSTHSITQNNQINSNQNIQQKIKREHSYSLNSQITQMDQNNQQNPQLSSSLIDQNKFKKPPRSTNEMRQSLQGSSQQQILISTQQINVNNHNENINFGNIENRNSQKQVAFSIQANQINEFSKQNNNNNNNNINNELSMQQSIQLKQQQQQQYYHHQQQQQQLQSSQRFEKFQKWNNQINSLI
ncbi:hypothetical protein TTHERM_00052550 (macronuclear) [Tetrahymena thermophila SB210]|uniref:Uncharacterized protein n=1 Tax=Tetrahymena thermophila (strain SB210) TaxID=312017 RepID=Q23CT5_TETTS|nr:hypothetical protein TTHERM_00052550 [Tetrahymena thermophila SB210]EAR94534.1 hypothetical protein TTHERM_00052550 [Tetrahymena thermophila SB210]|eukprot:XP_001014951.1 hypothetical protein TTHERM_00052550 [Tetrahymena thermophila SB210]